MTGHKRSRSFSESSRQARNDDDAWLERVAELASQDSGGVPSDLLGEYLPMLAEAATSGRFPGRAQIDAVRRQGRRAAEQGVAAGQGVDLYLSAARRVWSELPAIVLERNRDAVRAAATAVLQVVDDAVASFAEGHAEAGRERVRREETVRRELVEDLLRGDAHLSELVERAEPFGLDLTRAHQVALAEPRQRLSSIAAATTALERVVLNRFGDRDVLVATKDGRVVVLALAEGTVAQGISAGLHARGELGKIVHGELNRLRRGSPWRVAVGRPHPGAYGIARSYEEAREGLTMAARMNLDGPIVETRDVLTYRVLARDQPALVDLVHSVLNPLREARGGALFHDRAQPKCLTHPAPSPVTDSLDLASIAPARVARPCARAIRDEAAPFAQTQRYATSFRRRSQ